jgi:hypothetical protein
MYNLKLKWYTIQVMELDFLINKFKDSLLIDFKNSFLKQRYQLLLG